MKAAQCVRVRCTYLHLEREARAIYQVFGILVEINMLQEVIVATEVDAAQEKPVLSSRVEPHTAPVIYEPSVHGPGIHELDLEPLPALATDLRDHACRYDADWFGDRTRSTQSAARSPIRPAMGCDAGLGTVNWAGRTAEPRSRRLARG